MNPWGEGEAWGLRASWGGKESREGKCNIYILVGLSSLGWVPRR